MSNSHPSRRLHSGRNQAALLLQGAPPGFPWPTNGRSTHGPDERVSEGPRSKSAQQGQTLQQGQVPERQTRGRPDSSVSHTANASVSPSCFHSLVPCRANHICQQPDAVQTACRCHCARAPQGEACNACTFGGAATRAAHPAWPPNHAAPSRTWTAAKPPSVADHDLGLLHMHLPVLPKLHMPHQVADTEMLCTCLQPGSSVGHRRTNDRRRDAVADTQEVRNTSSSQTWAPGSTSSPHAAASKWEEDSGEPLGTLEPMAGHHGCSLHLGCRHTTRKLLS